MLPSGDHLGNSTKVIIETVGGAGVGVGPTVGVEVGVGLGPMVGVKVGVTPPVTVEDGGT